MTLRLDTLTFDSADVMRVALFWTDALFFQPVPEFKVAKDRVHLDLRPPESMAAEVERLEGLGATVVGRVDEEGSFWTVMQDPEGNELCVLRGPEDGWFAEA